MFIEGENTTSPASVLQMITRNRRINAVYICATKMRNVPEYSSFEQMCERLDTLKASKATLAPEGPTGPTEVGPKNNRIESTCSTLHELQDVVFNKETDEDDYSDNEFSRLYKQALWHDNRMRSSFLHQLDGLLECRGFKVNRQSIAEPPETSERRIIKARRVIGDAEADSLCKQQAEAKVEAYFEGQLSDSLEDKQQKELLDCKVGVLRGMNVCDIQRQVEWAEVEWWRNQIRIFMADNPSERQVCLEVFTNSQGVRHLRNIKYAAYRDEALRLLDEKTMAQDFSECNLNSATSNAQLLRRLLAVFNHGLPPSSHLKAYDLTLKQASYDENEKVHVQDEIWQHYTQGRRTRKNRPTSRKGLMECIITLSKELFGKKIIEKAQTSKKGETNRVYNYNTNTALFKVAIGLMSWAECTQDDIEPDFARRYGLKLKSSRATATTTCCSIEMV
jgi:hypothetical protein